MRSDPSTGSAQEDGLDHRLAALGQLAAGIAHEINTPIQYIGDNVRFLQGAIQDVLPVLEAARKLAAVAGRGEPCATVAARLLELLEAHDLDFLCDEIPRAIDESGEGVSRVSRIVQAMKDFSHPGADEMTAIDINKAIETTITVARNEWEYIAELEADLDPNMPPVPCFPREFNQVVLNIIVNAAHAITDLVGDSEQMGKITVQTRRAGERAEIRITDTGGGIPDAVRPRIFDPFFTTKEVGRGTGQGLSIAHGVIVRKHGGTLDFETVEGQGTTFTICLPLHQAEAEPQETAA